MLTKKEQFRLRQDFPEGIPGWMIQGNYTEKQVRVLMTGRRKIYDPPVPNPDAIPPEHRFAVEPEVWDDAVFTSASHFTVVIGRNPFDRTVHKYKSFTEAVVFAKTYLRHIEKMGNLGRPMIYAVTASGRHTMLVPKRWDHYLQLDEKKAETRA